MSYIGGCLSGIYANVKCAFDEYNFLTTQERNGIRIYGIRQMDDLCCWVSFNTTDDNSRKEAEKIKERILQREGVYKGGLILEEQSVSIEGNTFRHKFSGTEIIGTVRTTRPMYCKTRNKNWESLLQTGKQKILTYPPEQSFIPYSVKLGVQIGTLIRIRTQNTCIEDTIERYFKIIQKCDRSDTIKYSCSLR